jgi:hypothetical protein
MCNQSNRIDHLTQSLGRGRPIGREIGYGRCMDRRLKYRKKGKGEAPRRHLIYQTSLACENRYPFRQLIIERASLSLYPRTGSASNLIIARYRHFFKISFLGPEPFLSLGCPLVYGLARECHHVSILSPLSPTCLRPTSSGRPSRMPAYALPRTRFKSSSPSPVTSSPYSPVGLTPTSARRFVPETSIFGRTEARPP